MNYFSKLINLGTLYSLGEIFNKSLMLIFIPIYTTYLSPSDYGIIAMMSVTVALISALIFSPIKNGFIRHYYSPEFKLYQGELLFNTLLFLIIQSAFIAVVLFSFNQLLAGLILNNRALCNVVKLYAIILFFTPISSFALSFVMLQEKARFYLFVSLTSLLFSAGLIIYLLIIKHLTFYALIYGNLFVIFYSTLIILPIIIKNIKVVFQPSILKQPMRYGYPMLLSGVSNFLIQSGDRYVLKLFSSLSKVGIYSFGYNFASIIDIGLSRPLKNAINPLVYKQEENEEDLKEFLRSSASYFYLIGCFVCLILSLYGEDVFHLMVRTKDFYQGWPIVPIIAFSYVQHALGTIVGKGPAMAKKPFHISGMVGIACVINLGLNFLLIPYYGIMGAAFATLISYFVWNFLYIHNSAKFYRLFFDVKRLIWITLLGVGLYISFLLLPKSEIIWINLLTKMFILILYPIILLVTGFFSEKEREYIKSFFLTKLLKSEDVKKSN